ncbi:MAG: thiopeptide-type bacteriocin biosynthesis protein [Flavobacterium sp.]
MQFFDHIVIRAVSLPIQSYEKNRDDLIKFFSENKLFHLSLLVSSRTLYEDIKKNKAAKISSTLGKYFSRAHFNPVPFGTFSSVSCLKWGDNTNISKSDFLSLKVDFDNFYYLKKVQNLLKEEWRNYSFFTNPSIHFLSESKISFYKYEIKSNGLFESSFVEIDYDENIEWLINKFERGAKIAEVVIDLLENGFLESEIDNFLLEIINAGLIINEVSYFPYNKKLKINFKGIKSALISENVHHLKRSDDFDNFIQEYIKEQDADLKEDNIGSQLHNVTSFEENFGVLDSKIKDKIKNYIDFCLHYNKSNTINERLTEFGSVFYHNFDDGFVPLGKVFNPYSGLNYSSIKSKKNKTLNSELLTKIVLAKTGEVHFLLPKKASEEIENNRKRLPATCTVVFEVLFCKETGKEIIYFKHLGEASAINLIARFGHVTDKVIEDIVNYEKKVNEGKIIAEINMISNSRSINLFAERQYYDYNVALNTSGTVNSNSIPLSDIFIRYDGKKFILISKKYNKEIIPRVTSAINHKTSSSEIYKFLNELRSQDGEIYSVYFDFNLYKDTLMQYVPRIYLQDDILLHPAQIMLVHDNWNLKDFKDYLWSIIKRYSFTSKVTLQDPKGNIIIDLEREDNLVLLFERLKETGKLYVTEFLYDSFVPAVTRDNDNFSHELMVSVKNTLFENKKTNLNFSEDVSEFNNTPILADWLYFELYCNTYAENEILNYIYDQIISKNKVEQFFFVRYNNPDNHLRVRFKTNSTAVKKFIISKLEQLKVQNWVIKYQILPYKQELYRYGGMDLMLLTENFFTLDSIDTLENVLKKDLEIQEIFIISVLKLKYYLKFFDLNIEEMILFCENNILYFSNEFNLNADMRKSFNKDFSKIKSEIDLFDYKNFLYDSEFKIVLNNALDNSYLVKYSYISAILHMGVNRVFNENQRFHEFKMYYLAKCYLNQLKYTTKNIE